MTEVERIIKEGILPESFFKPETICDFYVDEKRKKIWAIQIDLLLNLDKICRKYGLKYYLSYGGLLGVIRHDGFIPWDDDLDVCMFRDDYEELLTHCNEFADPFYLDIPKVNNNYYVFAKLRNSRTTCIIEKFRYLENLNHGICLDIFPLDNSCLDDVEIQFNKSENLILENSTYMRRNLPNPTSYDLERFEKYPLRDPNLVYDEFEFVAKIHANENTDLVTTFVFVAYGWEKVTWKREWFGQPKDVDFYGYKIMIPNNPHEILKTQYNDYMQYPPIETRGNWHANVLFDTDVPYKDSLQRLLEAEKSYRQ